MKTQARLYAVSMDDDGPVFHAYGVYTGHDLWYEEPWKADLYDLEVSAEGVLKRLRLYGSRDDPLMPHNPGERARDSFVVPVEITVEILETEKETI
jgi:hypothetical protein